MRRERLAKPPDAGHENILGDLGAEGLCERNGLGLTRAQAARVNEHFVATHSLDVARVLQTEGVTTAHFCLSVYTSLSSAQYFYRRREKSAKIKPHKHHQGGSTRSGNAKE